MLPDNRPMLAKIFGSRKVWVAISGLALALITVLGLDPDTWTPVIGAIVVLATAVIAAIGYEDGMEKSAAGGRQSADPADGDNPQSAIRNPQSSSLSSNLLIALCAIGLLAASGCTGKTPAARWAQQRQALSSANNVFVDLADGGALSDEQILAIGNALQVASAHLDAAKQGLPEGGGDFESLLQRADHLLQLVEEQLKQAQARREALDGQTRTVPRPDQRWPGGDQQRDPGSAIGAAGR